jgi:hypothetical protein
MANQPAAAAFKPATAVFLNVRVGPTKMRAISYKHPNDGENPPSYSSDWNSCVMSPNIIMSQYVHAIRAVSFGNSG